MIRRYDDAFVITGPRLYQCCFHRFYIKLAHCHDLYVMDITMSDASGQRNMAVYYMNYIYT